MARERMITRTVEITKAYVMCLDVDTANVSIEEYYVTGTSEEKAIMKTLRKEHENDWFKLVKLQSTVTEERLYGMPESKFIELAEVLPPRNI